VVLAAYREDGSVESSFGSGGMVEIKGFGAGPRIGSVDIVEQPDGKLLLIGSTPRSAAVVRLLPDGARDPSFGRDGLTVIPPRALADTPECVMATTGAVTAEGRIAVAGMLGCGGEGGQDAGSFVARLRPNGQLDRTFARRGVGSRTPAATPPISPSNAMGSF
jgi:uncharacterized delta-60 repeat protein